MPTVSIGTTSKRSNSTLQTFTSSASLNCKLKEPCSMHSPTFIVQGLTKSKLYNYCSFEGHYYWVDDIVYKTNDIQEVHCHLDPLATFKNAIKATKAWVKYADSTHWNKKMDDIRMQPEMESISSTPTIADLFDVPFEPTDGTVLMRVMEVADTTAHQGVKTYAMSYSTFKYCLADLTGFFDGILDGIPGTGLRDFAQILAKIWASIGGVGSWRDNLLSVRYMPINISFYQGFATAHNIIYLGTIPAGSPQHYFYDLNTPVPIKRNRGSLTIPWAQDAQDYEFLRNPRWTAFQIMTPGGYQDIDPTDLKDQQSCGFFSAMDVATGEWSCKITEGYIDTGEILASFSGNIGIDFTGFVGSGASFASIFGQGAATAVRVGAGDYTSAASIGQSNSSTMADDIDRALYNQSHDTPMRATSSPKQQTTGSGILGTFLPSGISVGSASGGIGGGATNMFLFNNTNPGSLVFKNIQFKPKDLDHYADYCNMYGYPCNAYLTLGDITGYCCCVGASVQSATGASEADKSTINSFLNSGIYIE